MTDLMDTMYECASRVFTPELLNEDGEYFSRTRYLEEEHKRLCKELDKDTVVQVNRLLDEKAAISVLRESASFRAGFRMALELTR